MSVGIKIQLSHGHEKHEIFLESEDLTVGDLSRNIENVTGVPTLNQKLIFKGKSLSIPGDKLSSHGITNNSKLMLLGRKFNEKDEGFLKSMKEVEGSLKLNEAGLADAHTQFKDIKNGYLEAHLHSEAFLQMKKKVLSHVEQLTRLLETLDSLVLSGSSSEVQNKRKTLVQKIQDSLKKADELQECLEQQELRT